MGASRSWAATVHLRVSGGGGQPHAGKPMVYGSSPRERRRHRHGFGVLGGPGFISA